MRLRRWCELKTRVRREKQTMIVLAKSEEGLTWSIFLCAKLSQPIRQHYHYLEDMLKSSAQLSTDESSMKLLHQRLGVIDPLVYRSQPHRIAEESTAMFTNIAQAMLVNIATPFPTCQWRRFELLLSPLLYSLREVYGISVIISKCYTFE